MTREEAITLIKKLRTFHNGTYAKAIDMAIEALSSYDELYKKAKEVNDMANEILDDFPSYKEALSEPSLKAIKKQIDEHWYLDKNDLISRADAIEALSRSSVYIWSTEQDLVAHSWAISILQSLPSADRPTKCIAEIKIDNDDIIKRIKEEYELADRPQGEWIDVDNEPYCKCSVCGSYIDNLDDDYAFCPRCGARMEATK